LVSKFSIIQTNIRKQPKINNQIFQHGSTWAMIKIIWATTHKKSRCINGGNQTIVDPMIKTFLEKIEKQI
jgi:hypothetical protein